MTIIVDQPSKSLKGITIPVIIFGLIGIFCVFAFCLLKDKLQDIYIPRRILKKGRPPNISKSLFQWIPVVYKIEESFMVNTVGLDAVQFLRFLKLGYQLFFCLSLIGGIFLAPMNYFSNPPTFSNQTYYEKESMILNALSIDNIPSNSYLYKVLLVFCWLISFIAYGFLFQFFRSFITLKLQYDEYALKRSRMSKIEMRSVMVFGVPRDLRSEVELAVYFENLGIGTVDNVVLCRNWSLLQQACHKRAFYLEKLEKLYIQSPSGSRPLPSNSDVFLALQNADAADMIVEEIQNRYNGVANRPALREGFLGLFGPKLDSVNYYCKLFKEWDEKVDQLRKHPEKSAPSAVAFVTFSSPITATIVSQSVVHTDPFSLMIKMAPEPRAIYWPNLSARTAHNYSKFFRSLFAISILILLVTSSTIVVSSIATLIDLKQLAKNFPILGFISQLPPSWIQFIQGIIPVSLLATWNSLLPSVLLILCQLQGIEATSWIDLSLMSKYFFYLLWNIIIVIPLADTLVWKILMNPQQVIERLGEMLPKASITMLNLIILQGFAVFPAQLLLVAPLFLTWMGRVIGNGTPRLVSGAYYPSVLSNYINYGVIVPIPVIIFIIGLMYSCIAPIILPFCCLFFAIGYFVMKYIFLFVYFPDYESKGMATSLIVNRLLGGLVLMQFTMMGVLGLKAAENDSHRKDEWSQYAQMVVGILPLPVITFIVYQMMNQAYQKQVTHVPMEVLGKVQKWFNEMIERAPQDSTFSKSQELSDFSALDDNDKLRNRLSLFRGSSIRVPDIEMPLPLTNQGQSSSNIGSVRSTTIRRRRSVRSVLDPVVDAEPSPFHNPEDEDPLIDPVQPHTEYDLIDDQEEALSDLMRQHLEPPITRTSGILDVPLSASILRFGEHDRSGPEAQDFADDAQLHSYLHPCLIGKLPTPWFEGEKFSEMRREKTREQQVLLNRLISQQKLAIAADEREEQENDSFTSSVLKFIDGFTSWTHLTIS